MVLLVLLMLFRQFVAHLVFYGSLVSFWLFGATICYCGSYGFGLCKLPIPLLQY
jgi:hypothetical protein